MSKKTLARVLLTIGGAGVLVSALSLLSLGPVQACAPRTAVDTAVTVASVVADTAPVAPATAPATADEVPAGARILMEVYPDFVKGYQDGKILMSDGTTMTYDDKREKSFLQKLDDADLEDMFAFTYDRSSWVPGHMQDAGRSRCEAFFKKMYGASEAQVRKNLVTVSWFGQQVKFTRVNHAADSLKAVAAELANYPDLKRYLRSSGTFYWRKVRGANRQSAHSYGMTIDIGVKYSDYWLWKNPGKKETDKITYANRMPRKLVEIFERHGFIWGGRWYHYDTMHFEFRPEFLTGHESVE
ncbi:MAG: M15 family metallopeptidase [Muribaculaceae bacterium]|nr:M15 family metallopeptidase [Muribaculaceae bacterium]